jgi:hypothetical protein
MNSHYTSESKLLSRYHDANPRALERVTSFWTKRIDYWALISYRKWNPSSRHVRIRSFRNAASVRRWRLDRKLWPRVGFAMRVYELSWG